MDPRWICFHCAAVGTPRNSLMSANTPLAFRSPGCLEISFSTLGVLGSQSTRGGCLALSPAVLHDKEVILSQGLAFFFVGLKLFPPLLSSSVGRWWEPAWGGGGWLPSPQEAGFTLGARMDSLQVMSHRSGERVSGATASAQEEAWGRRRNALGPSWPSAPPAPSSLLRPPAGERWRPIVCRGQLLGDTQGPMGRTRTGTVSEELAVK